MSGKFILSTIIMLIIVFPFSLITYIVYVTLMPFRNIFLVEELHTIEPSLH